MHRLVWKKQARVDLLEIVRHIAQDHPDAAEKLADEVEAKADKLREYSKLFRVGRKRGARKFAAHSNYLVIYRIRGDDRNLAGEARRTAMALSFINDPHAWLCLDEDSVSFGMAPYLYPACGDNSHEFEISIREDRPCPIAKRKPGPPIPRTKK